MSIAIGQELTEIMACKNINNVFVDIVITGIYKLILHYVAHKSLKS